MTTDLRTPAMRIAEARTAARQPVALLIKWLIDRPGQVPLDSCLPAAVAVVGHDVTLTDLTAAVVAEEVRAAHVGLNADHTLEVVLLDDEDRVEETLDALLDLTVCDDCSALFATGDGSVECAHGWFCDRDCLTGFHGRNYCGSVDD